MPPKKSSPTRCISNVSESKEHNTIFEFMTTESKNIYNKFIFHMRIYLKYSNIIFKQLYDRVCKKQIKNVIIMHRNRNSIYHGNSLMIFNEFDIFINKFRNPSCRPLISITNIFLLASWYNSSSSNSIMSGIWIVSDEHCSFSLFSTYQSAHKLAKAYKSDESIDFGIFDETHKTTSINSNKQFSIMLTNKYLRIRKRLFMTATPIEQEF
jgi:hypothetical protein